MSRGKKDRSDVLVTDNGDAVYVPDGDGAVAADVAPAKPKETKSQRWRRLVVQRMPKTLHAMRRLIPLASRAQYDYSDEEVRQVLEALDSARADIGRAFAGQREAPATFRLI